MAKILVVDDDKGIRELLEIMLVREGYEVTSSGDPEKAIQRCRREQFDLVITDLRMPKIDGIEFLKNVKEISPETMVILITAYASGETAVHAMKEGAYDYIEKNFDIDDLKKVVTNALAKRGVRSEEMQFRRDSAEADSFGTMIGKSREMLKIYTLVKKVAQTPTNVLILGESGTGKELVAKAVHENSQRRLMPFVVINCGGLPETLLESELFGYMKGSFTGAYLDKPGLFEVAHKGTIFLDEIGDLPPSLQVKFLRAVQEKTFRRIGGGEDIKVDVRIIAATNRNLADKVREGTFREDLYWRLNVIPIHLPPLRERKEDIPLLAKHFIQKYSREFGKDVTMISAYALELLMSYPFPGNIRELENIIERCVALETSSIILPENLVIVQNTATGKEPWYPEIPDGGIMLNEELERFERNIIEKALVKAKGSKTKAAELLHVSPDSLRYRIDKLSIP